MIYKAAYDTLKSMQISSWQTELQQSITDPASLLKALELSPAQIPLAGRSLESFPLKVPWQYLAKIRKQDPLDPLLRQVIPLSDEDLDHQGYTADPLYERENQAVPGVLHKYYGRVLLIATGACAIHCRYCFRRQFPYQNNNSAGKNWSAALEYIRQDQTISEVILSGGDPLTLADGKLSDLITGLSGIEHVSRLRIHTRIPVVIPSRLTSELLDKLTETRLTTVIVIHCNHPGEIDGAVEESLNRIKDRGITLLNQSVLLKGVNDSVATLVELNKMLFECGVLPYYMHMLDHVAGSGHFEVPTETAHTLMHELRKLLPGYLVPRLVREVPGKPYKIPVL